jgi:tripartite ATP-independent transporter DctM subunit
MLGIIITIVFVLTVAVGIPIGFCLALVSLAGLLVIGGVPLHLMPQRIFTGIDSFPIMAVPFFVLAGDLMNAAGITHRIIRFSSAMVGHIRGGLAHVNIVASMFFAGVSGSAVADAAALGSILIPAMEEDGYDKTFAASVVASAAVIGPIIPPSIPMVIYGLMGSVSIGGLFLSGFVPGVMMGLGLMIVSYIVARRKNYGTYRPFSLRELRDSFFGAIIPLLMPVIILGGILSGVFTPTEAASMAVAYALFIGFFVLRTMKLKDLPGILYRSMLVTATILMVMGCANIFSWVIGTEMIPQKITQALISVSTNPQVLLLLINVLLLIVGCLMEGIAAIVLLVPILVPVAMHAGIHPLHFGLVVVLNMMIGLITPPVGLCLFVSCSLAKVELLKLARVNLPFLIIEIVVLMIVTYVPQLVLFVPHLFGY